jgi:hypothetical protein
MRVMLGVLALLAASPAVRAGSPTPVHLACNTGPVNKTYGGTKWQVYSCDDGQSLVVTAAPGSPAAPFYFLFAHDSTGYDLRGEGTGNRTATDAAYKDLRALTAPAIRALIAETMKH